MPSESPLVIVADSIAEADRLCALCESAVIAYDRPRPGVVFCFASASDRERALALLEGRAVVRRVACPDGFVAARLAGPLVPVGLAYGVVVQPVGWDVVLVGPPEAVAALAGPAAEVVAVEVSARTARGGEG